MDFLRGTQEEGKKAVSRDVWQQLWHFMQTFPNHLNDYDDQCECLHHVMMVADGGQHRGRSCLMSSTIGRRRMEKWKLKDVVLDFQILSLQHVTTTNMKVVVYLTLLWIATLTALVYHSTHWLPDVDKDYHLYPPFDPKRAHADLVQLSGVIGPHPAGEQVRSPSS